MLKKIPPLLILTVVVVGACYESFRKEMHLKRTVSYGISADHEKAVQIGMEILEQGGNAVDAAIAVSYALGVLQPFASGIGGGGLMLIHPKKGQPTIIDYKETAPSVYTSSTIGIPGFVKGMEVAREKYGTLPLKELLQPSIQLCDKGFHVTPYFRERLSIALPRLDKSQIPHFLYQGSPIHPGGVLRQKKLGETLRNIQLSGPGAFYGGEIAKKMRDASHFKMDDLLSYKVKETIPIKVNLKEYQLVTVPPPGGGVMLMQFLLMAEDLHLKALLSSTSIQSVGNMQHIVNRLRRTYMGDPDFGFVPVDTLLSKAFLRPYLHEMESKIKDNSEDEEIEEDFKEEDSTTHFVVVDKEGMMVSCTNTLSQFFGSGAYVEGFFLNNKCHSFSSKEHSPNSYEPLKRSITFTSPTIVTLNNKPVLGIGASGGIRITPMLGEVLIRHLFYKEPLQQAITGMRYYIKKRRVYVEGSLSLKTLKELRKKGYTVKVKGPGVFYGGVQAIRVNGNTLEGGYDYRREGTFMIRGRSK